MRSKYGQGASDDLTTKARIRDAAIAHIAQVGFREATVRAIAAAAGVSPGLVVHHFGSKEGLRQSCDEYVTDTFRAYVQDKSDSVSVARILTELSAEADSTGLATLTAYCVRALIDGGELAQQLFDAVLQDTVLAMRLGVESGLIRPAEDEPGRARMLAATSLGAALMARYMYPEEPDPVAIQRRLRIDVTLPGLELYTYGLFTDSSLLAEYRQGRHHDGHAQGTTTDGGPPGPASATTPSTPSTSRTSS